jgi:hypothetical protein
MNLLSLFGLFAVTATLYAMCWKIAIPDTFSDSRSHAPWGRRMAFCKAFGLLDSSKASGRSSQFSVGG